VNQDEEELPIGQVGELIVKGDNVMLGYYQCPEDTAATIKNGWLFTGDLARIDEEGYIYIVDRKKDLIIVNGLNVYPREVEVVLEGHPQIKEVAVLKGMSASHSEYPVAAIVSENSDQISPEELNRFCHERLAPYKIPRRYHFLDAFPKTPTGKILKRKIQLSEK